MRSPGNQPVAVADIRLTSDTLAADPFSSRAADSLDPTRAIFAANVPAYSGPGQRSTSRACSPLLLSIRRKASYSGPGPFTARNSSTVVSVICPPDAGFASCRTSLRPDTESLINRQRSPLELR